MGTSLLSSESVATVVGLVSMATGPGWDCEFLLTDPADLPETAGRPDVILMIRPGSWCTALPTAGDGVV